MEGVVRMAYDNSIIVSRSSLRTPNQEILRDVFCHGVVLLTIIIMSFLVMSNRALFLGFRNAS